MGSKQFWRACIASVWLVVPLATACGDSPPAGSSVRTNDDGKTVVASLHVHDNLTEGMMKTGARLDTIAILKYVKSKYPNAERVEIVGTVATKDSYGNEHSDTPAFDISYTKSTLDRINLSGVDTDKIWELRDSGDVLPIIQ